MCKKIKIKDILALNNSIVLQGNLEQEISECSTNTRDIVKGETFFAIEKGFDYIEQAIQKGAIACVVEKKLEKELLIKYRDICFVQVENTLETLQYLASLKRDKYEIPVIAITGSVGKTSTKDIIASVVGTEYDVLKTEGNFNNHIGLPLTIMRLKEHEALVVEMGMNNLNEIELLSKIAKPTIAVITNIGTSHIGNLGSRENILKAKLEILEGLKENGTVIINNDNDMLNMWNKSARGNNILTYGIEEKSDYMAENINITAQNSTFDIMLSENVNVNIPVSGRHFIYNALSAIVVGKTLNIQNQNIVKGIEKFELTAKRMEVEKYNGMTIINDAYNSSYESVKHALELLNRTEGVRKIAIIGDVLELGEFSDELHIKIGNEINLYKFDMLIAVGEASKHIYDVANCNVKKHFTDNFEVLDYLGTELGKGDVILLKASNGMKFFEILEGIKKSN